MGTVTTFAELQYRRQRKQQLARRLADKVTLIDAFRNRPKKQEQKPTKPEPDDVA